MLEVSDTIAALSIWSHNMASYGGPYGRFMGAAALLVGVLQSASSAFAISVGEQDPTWRARAN